MDDLIKKEINLIDCYRIAVDFGSPAAEKAIALINESLIRTKKATSIPEIKPASD